MTTKEKMLRAGLVLSLTMAAWPSQAEQLANLELNIGSINYTIKEPATTEEAIANMEAMLPNVVKFGRSGVFDRIGFRQAFVAKDKSAVEIGLLLPAELGPKLKSGAIELGGTTIESYADTSNQGWSDKCPDLEEDKAVLTLAHYGIPAKDATLILGRPAGDLERVFQTHHTRLRQDKATVLFTTVDLATRWIEGVAKGEVSWVVPKASDEANNKKTYDWMCKPDEYIIKTETFELHFAMQINKGWAP